MCVYRQKCVFVRERERENSNSKTLFYKDCSLGSVKNLFNNERERERENNYECMCVYRQMFVNVCVFV